MNQFQRLNRALALLPILLSLLFFSLNDSRADNFPWNIIPQKYVTSLKKLRHARRLELTPELNRFADECIIAYFKAGMPTSNEAIFSAMKSVDATIFLPALKRIVTSKAKPARNDSFLRQLNTRIKSFLSRDKINYFEVIQIIQDISNETLSLSAFPLAFEFPTADNMSKDKISKYFVLGLAPLELIASPKSADGNLHESLTDYLDHDRQHFYYSFATEIDQNEAEEFESTEVNIKDYDAEIAGKRFEFSLKKALFRLEVERIAKNLNLDTESNFIVFHELSFMNSDAAEVFKDKNSNFYQYSIEHHIINTILSYDIAKKYSRRERLFWMLARRAISFLNAPNPDTQRMGEHFFKLEYNMNHFLENPPKLPLETAMHISDIIKGTFKYTNCDRLLKNARVPSLHH